MSQWYDDRNNLADLWRWLEDRAEDPDPAYFIEKPWKWSPEFAQMMTDERSPEFAQMSGAPREDTDRLAEVEAERDRLRTREFNYLDEQKRLRAAVDGANGLTARAYVERDEFRKRAERAEAALREIPAWVRAEAESRDYATACEWRNVADAIEGKWNH